MKLRAILASILAACVPGFPVQASQHEGAVGQMLANPIVTIDNGPSDVGLPPVVCGGFDWVVQIGPRTLGAADTLTLDMAIIPFRTTDTVILLDDPTPPSRTFVRVRFADGLVDGLPYDRSGWNDVSVLMRPATQDYTLTVNGVQGGPFPYESECQALGGCFAVDAVTIVGGPFGSGAPGWIDSITLTRESAAGLETLSEQPFDTCGGVSGVALGSILITDAPRNVRAMQR